MKTEDEKIEETAMRIAEELGWRHLNTEGGDMWFDFTLAVAKAHAKELTKQRDYFIDVAGNGGGYWPPLSVEDALEDYEKNVEQD